MKSGIVAPCRPATATRSLFAGGLTALAFHLAAAPIPLPPAPPDRPLVSATWVQALSPAPDLELHLEFRGSIQEINSSFVVAVPDGPLPSVQVSQVATAPLIGSDLLLSESAPTSHPLNTPPVIEEFGYVRQHRLARVQISRRVTAPSDQRVTSAIIQLRYPPGFVLPQASALRAGEDLGPVRFALERTVMNPDQLNGLAVPIAQPTGELAPPDWTPLSTPWALRVTVTSTGLYRLQGADLLTTLPAIASVPRQDLRLVADGQVVPHTIQGAGPSTAPLQPSDSLIFYAEATSSSFSRFRALWLVPDPSLPGKELRENPLPANSSTTATVTTSPHRHTTEQDLRLVTRNDQFLTILDHRWVWRRLVPGKSEVFEITLPQLDQATNRSGPLPVSLRFFATEWNYSAQPVVIRAEFPGESAQTITMTTQDADSHTILVSPDRFSHQNTTTFSLTILPSATPESMPELYFDSATVAYSRRLVADPDGLIIQTPPLPQGMTQIHRTFEVDQWLWTGSVAVVSGPTGTALLPTRVDPERRTLRVEMLQTTDSQRVELRPPNSLLTPNLDLGSQPPTNLRAPLVGNLVLVEYGPLAQAMNPLVDRLRQEGHSILRVNIRDLYDQFAAGQETPWAIRRFLAWHYRHGTGGPRGPAASTVILVGDCTSAFRNEFRNQVYNQVPSFPHHGATYPRDRFASDSWFGLVSGNDELADVVLGRFSLNSLRDLSGAVEKTLRDRDAAPGPQLNTVTFVSDHSEFEDATNRLLSAVPVDRFLRRMQLSDEPWVDNFYFPREIADAKKAKVSPSATSKVRALFQEGPRLFTFLGHGSPNIWSTERIWFGGDSENSDILSLHHPNHHPILINMTCNSGAIDYPMPRWNIAISEDFLRHRDGGPVACYVPSGPGTTPQHEKLTRELLRAFFEDKAPTLGEAVTLAMLRYQAAGNPADFPRMFILLGDPQIPTHLHTQLPASPDVSWRQRLALDGVEIFRSSDLTTSTDTPQLSPSLPTHRPGQGLPVTEVTYGTGDPSASRRVSLDLSSLTVPPLVMRLLNPSSPVVVESGTNQGVDTIVRNPHRVSVPLNPETCPGLVIQNQEGEILHHLKPQGPESWIEPASARRLRFALPTLPPGLYQIVPATRQGQPQATTEKFGLPGQPLLVLGQDPNPPVYVLATDHFANITPSSIGVTAALRVQIANARRDTTTRSISLALAESPESAPWPSTWVSVPDLAPLEVRQQVINLGSNGPLVTTPTAVLRLAEPTSFPVQLTRRPLVIGSDALPDLALHGNLVQVSSQSPTEGDTVFLDAVVENRGSVPAYQVSLEGSDITVTTSPVPMISRIQRMIQESIRLDPHTSRTLRLRWDPFANSGQRRLRLSVRSSSITTDKNPGDNTVELDLKVRTKHRLRRGPVAVLPPDQKDIAARRLRFIARIINEGESDAHAVRVTFYGSPQRTPANRLGEVLLERVPPGHSDAILTYQLKPGDESRKFTPTVEAVQRGSSQRLLVTAGSP